MKKITNWQIGGFAFSIIVGTFFHFIFDLTDRSIVTALFSPVNESIWEHLKLLYFPMLLFSLFEYMGWGKEYEGFWCVKLKGILWGLVLIPTIYYTYTGIIGKSLDWLNVIIFFVVAAVVYFFGFKIFQQEKKCRMSSKKALLILSFIGILFFVFTFYTPKMPFFQDPITKTYGF